MNYLFGEGVNFLTQPYNPASFASRLILQSDCEKNCFYKISPSFVSFPRALLNPLMFKPILSEALSSSPLWAFFCLQQCNLSGASLVHGAGCDRGGRPTSFP